MPEAITTPSTAPTAAKPSAAPAPQGKGAEPKTQPVVPSTPATPQDKKTDSAPPSPDGAAAKPGEGAAKPEDTKPEGDGASKTFKLVVKGKEVDVPAEHYHRLAQKGLAADLTLREMAEYRKSTTAFVEALKNPATLWGVLEKLGHDPLKVASELVYDRGVRREKMSEAERELEDTKAKLAAKEEAERRAQEESITRAEAEKVKYFQHQFSRDIISAMDATPELPKTAETVSRLAFYMRQELRARMEAGDDRPVRAADFVPRVLKEFQDLTLAFLKNRDGRAILDLVGDETRKKLREAELAAIEKTPQNQAPSTNGSEPRSTKKMTPAEWDELVRKRAGM